MFLYLHGVKWEYVVEVDLWTTAQQATTDEPLVLVSTEETQAFHKAHRCRRRQMTTETQAVTKVRLSSGDLS